jgi:phosphoribosyl-ATP pyrophosphohydrolase
MNEIFALPRRKKTDSRRRSAGADKTPLRRPGPLEDRANEPPAPVAGVHPAARHASMGQLPGAVCCELERLYASLGQVTPASNPRTFKLLEAGTRKIAQKVIEEAGEVALEAVKHHAHGVVRESADLLYHLVVLWCRAGVEPATIWQEMQTRASALGIAEKLPKTFGHKSNQDNSNC